MSRDCFGVVRCVNDGDYLESAKLFVPVARIIPYDDVEEAVDAVISSRYGRQWGLFNGSTKLALKLFRRLRTGAVIVNGTNAWRTDQLAYGGVKDSGIGREGPRYAIRDITEEHLSLFNM